MKARAIAVALWVPLLACCGLLKPVTIDTKKEVLSQVPGGLPAGKTRAATLLVLEPETTAEFDTTQMAYRIEPYQVAYFSHNEWEETPSRMIQPLIAKTLQQSRYFSEVASPPFMGRYTYALRTEIVELTQDFTSEPATLRLAMRFHLARREGDALIATKEIVVREAMGEKTPYAGVVAANSAVASALRQLAQFVLEKTA
jgi:cholesterol transport system auxiliary component